MIPDITELNFPKKDGKQYATLTQATANIADMGEKTITTQVKIDGEIVPDFSFDWEVEFQGEKYIMPLRIPQGAKENTSLNSTIDLTFQHWAIYQLKRWPFVTIQQIEAGTYLPDEEEATVSLNLKDFCILFGQVLEYYYGGAITIDLNPAWQYESTATVITISHTKIWDVLIDAFHDKYGVRWEIKAAADNSNTVKGGERYVIRVGYPTTEVEHIFEYGFEGGLLKVERQVQSEEIRNMLKGRGGDTNIPFRYFKNTDPNNKDFRPDPDWVEELANIPFTNLMGATFRSYVQGWKAAHINKTDAEGKKLYDGYKAVGESNAYAPWAYRKGYTDTKFAPVEFVADEIVTEAAVGDRYMEILPGYTPAVREDSSLDKYGPLPDTLDDNDEIYPTLQGTGMDIAVDVEQIESDDVTGGTENDAEVSEFDNKPSVTVNVAANGRTAVELTSDHFIVDAGKIANLDEGPKTFHVYKEGTKIGNAVFPGKLPFANLQSCSIEVAGYLIEAENASIVVVDVRTGKERSASGIPAGEYYFKIKLILHNTSKDQLKVVVSCESPKVTSATIDEDRWKNTFDIWVKNIWNSTRLTGETDSQYAERVWKPVLGDREGNEAKVVFTSGALAVSEDYEFTIVDFPVLDTSRTWEEKDDNGVVIATHYSCWRITLAKSDAEREATGLYVPNTKKQGRPGDRFVFIGTEMTHIPYVTDAEVRLDNWKKDQLAEKKEIKPTFVVTLDRVRINNEGKAGALIDQLRAGNSVTLRDKRFIDGGQEVSLYLQSIKYTYREPTSDDAAINPDVEIVLGHEYATSANPVSMMQGEISALQRQIGSISNVEQIVRATGDRRYIRKDRKDRTPHPLTVGGLLTVEAGVQSENFLPDLYAGRGFGIDSDGNAQVESIEVRSHMKVLELIVNRLSAIEGDQILTESDTIESFTLNEDGTYDLRLRQQYEGYFTAMYAGDVCKGIVNTLARDFGVEGAQTPVPSGTKYYTSWFRVNSVNTSANMINVTLYADDETPAGRNFPPCELMTFARWGNQTVPTRQSCFYISSTEGRIVKLSGVTKPIIDKSNYGATFGTVPDFLKEMGLPLIEGQDYVYARGLIVEDIVRVDYQGKPIVTIVDRGPWTETADYFCEAVNPSTGVYETSDVWYKGCKYRCMRTGTRNAPAWNGTDWAMVEGNPDFAVDFAETDFLLDPDNVDVTLEVIARLHNIDITDDIRDADVEWTRYSEDAQGVPRTASDNAWALKHAGAGKRLHLTGADMDFNGYLPKVIRFTATVTLRDGTGDAAAEAQASFEY